MHLMRLDNVMTPALRELTEQAAKERDPQTLGQLVWEINLLLEVIERRVAELGIPTEN